jgi:hypothetical protein
MDVNALHKDELEFELACRGVYECQNVATMRKFLREMFRREASGQSSIVLKVPIACIESPGSEIRFCRNKFAVLGTLIAEVSHDPDSSLIRRINTRLTHLENHIKLIVPTEQADTVSHLALLKEVGEAISALKSIGQEDNDHDDSISEQDKLALHQSLGDEAAKILEQLGMNNGADTGAPKQEQYSQVYGPPTLGRPTEIEMEAIPRDIRWNMQGAVPRVPVQTQGLQRSSTIDQDLYKRKLVPIKDWGVKFSGRGSLSVNAFLERIDELKDARNADDDDLFRYAIDFFEEEALIWFRANKNAVSSWSELVKLLVNTFQRPNYQDELLEEIKGRTQSKQESIVIYVSIMQNMFNRLPIPLTELQKLVILRKNVQPYFQKEVCRDTFNTVAEFTSVMRMIEHTKLSCESFREPTLTGHSLERDLAYQGAGLSMQYGHNDVLAIGNNLHSQSKCWNCRSPGHRFRDCNLPKQRLFCYKCGRFGNTVEKCTCSKNMKGNDHSESMSADRTPKN